jgi:hypothetical protein
VTDFPAFEAPFLSDFVIGLVKTMKTVKRGFRRIDIGPTRDPEYDMEVFDLTFWRRGTGAGLRIHLKVWQDRWVWIDARESSKKGWKWFRTFDGRLAGGMTGSELLNAVLLFNEMLPPAEQKVDSSATFWTETVLRGPRSVLPGHLG